MCITPAVRSKHCAFPAYAMVLCLLLAGCAGTGGYRDSPQVALLSIEPLDLPTAEQHYALRLRILNPNDVALPVSGIDYSIEINRQQFAYGVSRQSVQIPAHGEALLDVEVVSRLLNVLRQAQQLAEQGSGVIGYRVSGRLSLERSPVRVPFDYSGQLNWVPAAGKG
jgi:LEA14-like dessication related protein